MGEPSSVEGVVSQAELDRRKEKARRRKAERKVRRRERAGRAAGQRATPAQLVREFWRASILRVGKNNRQRLNGVMSRDSLIGDPHYFDASQFPFTKPLQDSWRTIRAEAEAVLEAREQLPALHEISPDHDRLSNDGTWKAFILYGYGIRSEFGCARCPETAKLLEHVPGLWSAFFSILEPGSHLPRHRGPTKAIITWHLGLIVPEPSEKCWIEVKRERRLWGEGESLIFDDATKHEVRNDADSARVVLLIHFRRPMKSPGSWLGRAFLTAARWSPFISDARRNQTEWEKAFEKATAARDPERRAS